MDKLRDLILDELKREGFNLISAMEIWFDFKAEIMTFKPGLYTFHLGKLEITFRKV